MNPECSTFIEPLEPRLLLSVAPVADTPGDHVGTMIDHVVVSSSAGSTVDPAVVPSDGLALLEIDDPDFGADIMPAARWDVVPFQTFDTTFEVGVVAFHIVDIDRVEFSINAGPVVSVSEMTLNPRTGVVEYWTALDAGDYGDGAIDVNAIAYPTVGIPRVLEPLTLYADSGGTLPRLERYVSASTGSNETGDGSAENPFATVDHAVSSIQVAQGVIDGGVIYLDAGDYKYEYLTEPRPFSGENGRWLTIRPMEGVSREQVRFVDGQHPGLWRTNIHLQDVSIVPLFDRTVPRSNGGSMWFDGVAFIGPGYTVPHLTVSTVPITYWTDSIVRNLQTGYWRATLVRNSRAEDIGEDAFKLVDMVVNSSVDRMHFGLPEWHPDVWQNFVEGGELENLIVYGLKAERSWAQGLNVPTCISCAFVGVDINNVDELPEPTKLQNFQISGPHTGTLIKDSRFIGRNVWRLDQGFIADQVVVDNVVFDRGMEPFLPIPYDPPSVFYRNMPVSIPINLASLQVGTASDVTYLSSVLQGTLIGTGGDSPEVVFVWGASDGGDTIEAWDHAVNIGVINQTLFGVEIFGLDPSTTYFYSAYGVNDAGVAWAEGALSFTTAMDPILANPSIGLDFDGSLDSVGASTTGAFWIGESKYGSGYSSEAAEFSGHSISSGLGNLVMIPGGEFLSGIDAFTVALWVRKLDVSETQTVISAGGPFSIEIQANHVKFQLKTTLASFEATFFGAVNDTQWHHLAITYDQDKFSTYIDHVAVWTTPFLTGELSASSHGFIVVGGDPFGRSFNGLIDQVRLYKQALTSEQISELAPPLPAISLDTAIDNGAGQDSDTSSPWRGAYTRFRSKASRAWIDRQNLRRAARTFQRSLRQNATSNQPSRLWTSNQRSRTPEGRSSSALIRSGLDQGLPPVTPSRSPSLYTKATRVRTIVGTFRLTTMRDETLLSLNDPVATPLRSSWTRF